MLIDDKKHQITNRKFFDCESKPSLNYVDLSASWRTRMTDEEFLDSRIWSL